MTLQGYYLGCPIWGNKDWVGELFTADARPKDFLPQYASVFNTVEGNTTFYALPAEATTARWQAETPADFRFAFKFPRAISHQRRLRYAEAETAPFLALLHALRDRLGPAFLQLPPSFGPAELPHLDTYLADLPKTYTYAVEVRHSAFFGAAEAELEAVLSAHGVDRVVFDTRGLHGAAADDPAMQEAQRKKPRAPVRFRTTGVQPFVRFIGRSSVDENVSLLVQWASVVAGWMAEGRTPYVFFHAPDDVYAPRLARAFHQLLLTQAEAGTLPAWPGETAQPEPAQMRLL
jgi:uncharacterized protein YecE (DUF72 family)